VTVEDTLPPQLEIPADQVVYACAPPTVQLLPRRLEDTCDFEPEMDIRLISVNGIAANVPYTPQLQFPFGRSLVRYTATDEAGNSVSAVQTVDVERGDSCCPAGALKFVGNAANNTLNGNASQPSCLVGYDGADRLYGNLRFDTLLGGRGDDLLEDSPSDLTFGAFVWGGMGNDTLRSRSPATVLLGGPGDDVVFYTGSSTVRIRGGAGKDTLESTSRRPRRRTHLPKTGVPSYADRAARARRAPSLPVTSSNVITWFARMNHAMGKSVRVTRRSPTSAFRSTTRCPTSPGTPCTTGNAIARYQAPNATTAATNASPASVPSTCVPTVTGCRCSSKNVPS
jgi:hypothetical protein